MSNEVFTIFLAKNMGHRSSTNTGADKEVSPPIIYDPKVLDMNFMRHDSMLFFGEEPNFSPVLDMLPRMMERRIDRYEHSHYCVSFPMHFGMARYFHITDTEHPGLYIYGFGALAHLGRRTKCLLAYLGIEVLYTKDNYILKTREPGIIPYLEISANKHNIVHIRLRTKRFIGLPIRLDSTCLNYAPHIQCVFRELCLYVPNCTLDGFTLYYEEDLVTRTLLHTTEHSLIDNALPTIVLNIVREHTTLLRRHYVDIK